MVKFKKGDFAECLHTNQYAFEKQNYESLDKIIKGDRLKVDAAFDSPAGDNEQSLKFVGCEYYHFSSKFDKASERTHKRQLIDFETKTPDGINISSAPSYFNSQISEFAHE